MRFVSVVVLNLVVCFAAVPALGAELDLSAGTMQLGGNVSFRGEVVAPDGGDNVTGYELSFSPNFGIFVVEGLELLVRVTAQASFGDLNENDSNLYGFDGGVRYHFPTTAVVPYVGVELGYSVLVPKGGSSLDDLDIFNLSIPAGILIALNESVAVDVGVRFNYQELLDGSGSIINVPVGYLGVQAFFGGDRL